MIIGHALHPTLWRTCRVLANRIRLEIFGLLLDQPPQTVSTVARRLRLSRPLASQYLRALESRGFLTARRQGRRVSYRVREAESSAAQPLLQALCLAFRRAADPIEPAFKSATAFTHPRRIEIFRLLTAGARSFHELRALTGISRDALNRHLTKLEGRGFVVRQAKIYAVAKRRDGVGRALAGLASAR